MFFGLTRFQSYTGTILLAQGNDRIPVEFSEIEMNVKGEKIAILTGRDGVFYFENIMEQKGDGISGYRDMGCKFLEVTEPRPRRIEPGKYKASFSFSGKMCSFEMDIPDSAELEVDLGQIVCIPEPLPEEQPVKPVQPH